MIGDGDYKKSESRKKRQELKLVKKHNKPKPRIYHSSFLLHFFAIEKC